MGSAINEASDMHLGGGSYSYEARSVQQNVTWQGRDASGNTLTYMTLGTLVPRPTGH